MQPKVLEGQRVAVRVFNSRTREVETQYGVCEGIVAALDRPYRINVQPEGQPGRYWRECAPECVEAA